MKIIWKSEIDRARVWNGYRRAREQRKTLQRDRYNVILLLGDGGPDGEELQREQIASVLKRSRQFVDEWARRYRAGGFDAIVAGKAKGAPPKLTPQQDELLRKRLDASPAETDGVCALRGKDIRRIIEEEFGVIHTMGGIYKVLDRLGYSTLMPRPVHRKNDPEKAKEFIDSAPFLSGG